MKMTIRQEAERLSSFLEVIPLQGMKENEKERYQRMADRFHNRNTVLKEYIQRPFDDPEPDERNAWTDLSGRETNTYLVVDKSTHEIVFYFSLCCGLLYSDVYTDKEYTDAEFSFLNTYRFALNMNDGKSLKQLEGLAESFGLTSAIRGMKQIYRDAKKDRKNTREKGLSQTVVKTFPAIELTHFARNTGYYGIPVGFRLKLGAFVFWEYIVPEVLRLSRRVAARYLYLYAADWTRFDSVHSSRLISYYQNHLRFQPLTFVNNRKMIKPAYDFECFGMIQDVDALKKHKKAYFDSLK